MPNCFIGLRARFRNDCGREYRGRDGFDRAIDDVENDWVGLFKTLPRFGCFPLSNCMEGATDDDI
jgi:hypothetical protein